MTLTHEDVTRIATKLRDSGNPAAALELMLAAGAPDATPAPAATTAVPAAPTLPAAAAAIEPGVAAPGALYDQARRLSVADWGQLRENDPARYESILKALGQS